MCCLRCFAQSRWKFMRTSFFKTIYAGLALLLCGLLLAVGLLYAANAIPVSAVKKHALASAELLMQEGTYPWAIEGEFSSILDNFTDALMLSVAFYDGEESLTERVFSCYKTANPDPVCGLYNSLTDPSEESSEPYGRYWHGYLVTLRPLLCLMDYAAIRVLNLVLQSLLVLAICFFMWKRGLRYAIIPFLVTLVFLTPASVYKSLQLSTVVYISLAGMLALLLFDKKLSGRYPLFFMALGMATAFFDLLTYPLVSLGLPLVLYFLCKGPASLRSGMTDLFVLPLCWCIGYGCMWAGKWLLWSLVSSADVWGSIRGAIAFRVSDNYMEHTFSFGQVVSGVLGTYYNSALYKLPFGAALLYCLYLSLRVINDPEIKPYPRMKALLPILGVCLFPFVWWRVLLNHSAIHPFPAKQIASAVFALLCYLAAFGRMPFPKDFTEKRKKNRKVKRV